MYAASPGELRRIIDQEKLKAKLENLNQVMLTIKRHIENGERRAPLIKKSFKDLDFVQFELERAGYQVSHVEDEQTGAPVFLIEWT